MKPRHTIHFLLLALLCVPALALAQGTAYTYQGQLKAASGPANGRYDLKFTLYDASAVGNVIAGPITNAAVAVSKQLLTKLSANQN